jgi:L-alanine-DL-glutamate epimerase-like enolase superfamily enzyme
MKITDLTAIPVSMDVLPLEDGGVAPYVGSTLAVDTVKRMLVRLDTDEGISGWGEMRPELGIETTVAFLEQTIAPGVVGRNVWEIEAFTKDPLYTEYTNVASFVAAVEMAMLDAYGKYVGEPVHRLVGGKCTDSVEFAEALGILDPEESRQYARRTLERGFDVLKLKAGPPNSDWENDVARVEAMYDEVDGQLEFRLDPNQTWSFDEAVRVGAKLEDAGIYLQYFEQPVRIDAHGTYKRLRNRLRTPIGVNEDTYHPRNLKEFLGEDAVDVAVVDLIPSGGIVALKKLAALADQHGISMAHHCGFDLGVKTAAVVHAVSSTPAINLPSDTAYHNWSDDVIADPFDVVDGCIEVPDDPGLGVEVDHEKIEQYRID